MHPMKPKKINSPAFGHAAFLDRCAKGVKNGQVHPPEIETMTSCPDNCASHEKAAPENRGGQMSGVGRCQMLFFAIWSAM
jgi:hypothetical protein